MSAAASVRSEIITARRTGGFALLLAGLSSVLGCPSTEIAGPADIESIRIVPSSQTVFLGGTVPFQVSGERSDGSEEDITEVVDWSVKDSDVATIDDEGVATGHAEGATTITATFGDLQSTAFLTVTGETESVLVDVYVNNADDEIVHIEHDAAMDTVYVKDIAPLMGTGPGPMERSLDLLIQADPGPSGRLQKFNVGEDGTLSFDTEVTVSAGTTARAMALDAEYNVGFLSLLQPAVTVAFDTETLQPISDVVPAGDNITISAMDFMTVGQMHHLFLVAQQGATRFVRHIVYNSDLAFTVTEDIPLPNHPVALAIFAPCMYALSALNGTVAYQLQSGTEKLSLVDTYPDLKYQGGSVSPSGGGRLYAFGNQGAQIYGHHVGAGCELEDTIAGSPFPVPGDFAFALESTSFAVYAITFDTSDPDEFFALKIDDASGALSQVNADALNVGTFATRIAYRHRF